MSASNISILIVEDDPIIAADLTYSIQDLGYSPYPALRNADDTLLILKNVKPDCILMDVTLEGKMDGIRLAEEINKIYNIPIIFLTAHHDKNTIERIKRVHPSAYLVKPLEVHTLQTSIELALYNHSHEKIQFRPKEMMDDHYVADKFFFIKVKNQLKKVLLDDILYFEAYDNYAFLFTSDNKYILSSNLKVIEQRLQDHQFIRIHRSYLINLNHIAGIEDENVLIGKSKLSIGKTYRDDFMKRIELL